MSIAPRPLRLVLVSPDIGLLHDLSWMLTAVGYNVVTSKDVAETAAWRQFSDVDFVLFDGRSVSNPTPATLAHRSDYPVYRIFLYDPAAAADLSGWFAAGANDALRVPVSRGELLARIRTGARLIEFENRMRSQSNLSRLPGIYSLRGLLRKLNKFTTEGKSVTLGHTLLTTTVDFFAGVVREAGNVAAWELTALLAESIQQAAGTNAIAGYVADGTFQVLLPGLMVAAARDVAEQIAEAVRTAQVEGNVCTRLTVTTAIVPWRVGVRAERLLEEGLETLAIAKQSGGDCAIEQNDFAEERASWQNELAAGSPFANVIAQDIMEPFPAVLERQAANPAMLAALRRSGAPVWPFVDRDGHLVGVASPESATNATSAEESALGEGPALAQPVTIPYNAAFPEIFEAFSTQGCLIMVVVADQRPIGYLTCRGFLSLIEPIDSATFSSDATEVDDSRSLLVGSLVNEDEPSFGSDQ